MTETPPSTPNGFGITLANLFKSFRYDTIFTDKSFLGKSTAKNLSFAHCPNHKSKFLFPLFILGLIPEWRGHYSPLWLFFFLRNKYDIVYSFFYSMDNLKFAYWISKEKKARLIVHVADHCVSFFKNPVFEKIIKNSYRRACIGVNMQESYEQRFNIPFKVFHNYADNKHLPLKSITPSMFSDTYPLKILFIGSIFENLHQGSIQDLCSVIRKMNSEGKPIIFEFYGQMQPTDYLKKEIDNISICHHGKINPESRFRVMEQYHVFVVPSSFDKTLSVNYSLSIPTKLPELLASGRPTIVYGPNSMEANRFCKQLETGILIEEQSTEALEKVFSYLLENYKNELSKARTDFSRNSNVLFGVKCQKEFSKFILN